MDGKYEGGMVGKTKAELRSEHDFSGDSAYRQRILDLAYHSRV